MTDALRIADALDLLAEAAGTDGEHHKQWFIDQIVRTLTGCPTVTRHAKDVYGREYSYQALGESEEYLAFVADYERVQRDDDWDETWTNEWNTGIAP